MFYAQIQSVSTRATGLRLLIYSCGGEGDVDIQSLVGAFDKVAVIRSTSDLIRPYRRMLKVSNPITNANPLN